MEHQPFALLAGAARTCSAKASKTEKAILIHVFAYGNFVYTVTDEFYRCNNNVVSACLIFYTNLLLTSCAVTSRSKDEELSSPHCIR